MVGTRSRQSLAWTIPAALTASAREALFGVLDCCFSDEDEPRMRLPVAPDVDLVVVPEATSCTVVAHFRPRPGLPATKEAWLTTWIRRASQEAGLPAAGEPRVVEVGPPTP